MLSERVGQEWSAVINFSFYARSEFVPSTIPRSAAHKTTADMLLLWGLWFQIALNSKSACGLRMHVFLRKIAAEDVFEAPKSQIRSDPQMSPSHKKSMPVLKDKVFQSKFIY